MSEELLKTRWKVIIEYDGRPFCGWQRQENASNSIQEVLEKALFQLTGGEQQNIYAAGRTDAGVHARGQVAHFDLVKNVTEKEILFGLNDYLKDYPISILEAEKVSPDFHARFSAKARSYRYQIINRRAKLALDDGFYWQVYQQLDEKLMQEACAYFIGTHDFTSFRTVHCQSKSPIKTITSLGILRRGDKIFIDIHAPSFLHHQVRNITGTLVEVGKGKILPSDVKKMIEGKDRRLAGPTAPSEGLYFMSVDYI